MPADPLNTELEICQPVSTRQSNMVNGLGWLVGTRWSNICSLLTNPLNTELEMCQPVGTRWSNMVNGLGWPVSTRWSNICTLLANPFNTDLDMHRPVGTRWSNMVNGLGWLVSMRRSNGEYVPCWLIHSTLNWMCVSQPVIDRATRLMDWDGQLV